MSRQLDFELDLFHLTELAARHPEFGFKKMFLTLRRRGHPWNHKRVYLGLLLDAAQPKAQTLTKSSTENPIAATAVARLNVSSTARH